MSIKIRLTRGGSKKDAHYSIVVIQSTRKRDGKYIEKIGHYHPCVKDDAKRFHLNTERCSHWISVGALPTDIVVKLMKKASMDVAKFEKKIVQHKYQGVAKKDIPALKKKEAEEIKAAKAARIAAAAEQQSKVENATESQSAETAEDTTK